MSTFTSGPGPMTFSSMNVTEPPNPVYPKPTAKVVYNHAELVDMGLAERSFGDIKKVPDTRGVYKCNDDTVRMIKGSTYNDSDLAVILYKRWNIEFLPGTTFMVCLDTNLYVRYIIKHKWTVAHDNIVGGGSYDRFKIKEQLGMLKDDFFMIMVDDPKVKHVIVPPWATQRVNNYIYDVDLSNLK